MVVSLERSVPAACLALALATPAVGQEWTEREAVVRFLETSPLVAEARARADSVSADSRARAVPSNPSVSYRREWAGTTDFIEGAQTLPLTGRLGLLKHASVDAERAARADADARIWTMRTEVRLAFVRALAEQERETVAIDTLAQLDELVAILRTREEGGEGSRFDRLRAERERAAARADLVSSRLARRRALGTLAAFYPPTVTVGPRLAGTTTPQPLEGSREAHVARALAARADHRAESARVARFDAEGRAAGRLAVPEVTLSGGAKRADLDADGRWGGVFGISVSLPLFTRGRHEGDRARADAAAARFRLEAIRQQVTTEVTAAHEIAEEAARGFAEIGHPAPDAETELLAIARLSYEEGEIGVLELLDAWRIDRQSRLRALALRAEARLAQIALEGVVGEEVVP